MYTEKKLAKLKLFKATLSVAFMTMLLTSCLSDSDDSSAATNTCYVSKVSFDSFRRLVTTKATDGITDSTYYSTYTASKWTFSIDHRLLFIENRDSLPYNTDLSRVVMNLTYNAGLAYYRASDAWEDDPWIPYSSSDSIDIRKPLHIKLIATDKTERHYTLRINVHTMESDSLRWVPMESNELISGAYPMKAISWNNNVCVMVNDGNAVLWMTHPSSNLGEWNRQVTDLPLNTDLTSLAKGENALFINTEDGALYSSGDGQAWTKLYEHEGLRLMGVSGDKLYAIFNSTINSTFHGTNEWKAETLDEDASLLPNKEIAAITYAQTEDLTRMILIGKRNVEADTSAVVWSKCWMDFENENTESWMHYNRTWDNTNPMPLLTQMNLMHYDNMLMVAGGQSEDGKIQALERFYVSRDNGLTWWPLQSIIPPSDLHGIDGYLTSVVDESNFLWLIAGGKIYRGRINRLGFARPDIY